MIKDMSELRIIGSKSAIKKIISTLHRLKVLHTIEREYEGTAIGMPLERAEQVSDALVHVRSIMAVLGINSDPSNSTKAYQVADILTEVKNLAEHVRVLDSQAHPLSQKEKEDLLHKANILERLRLEGELKFSSLSVIAGSVKNGESLLQDLRKKTTRFSLRRITLDGQEYIGVCIDKSFEEDALAILSSYSFSPLDINDMGGLDINTLRNEISQMKEKKEEAARTLSSMSTKY